MQQSDLSDWARKAIQSASLSQAEVSRRLTDDLGRSIDRAAVNKMLAGGRRIAVDEMAAIARITGAALPVEAGPGRSSIEPLGDADLEVFAAVEGGDGYMVVSPEALNTVPRPWFVRGVRGAYAVLVAGESMEPAFSPGDLAIINPHLPPKRDQDVILVAGEDEGEFRASIKRLVGWDAKVWRLRQFNPPAGQKAEFTLPREEWPKALRVVGKLYGG